MIIDTTVTNAIAAARLYRQIGLLGGAAGTVAGGTQIMSADRKRASTRSSSRWYSAHATHCVICSRSDSLRDEGSAPVACWNSSWVIVPFLRCQARRVASV